MKQYFFKHKPTLALAVGTRVLVVVMQVYVAIVLQTLVDQAAGGEMNAFVQYLIFALIFFIVFGIGEYLSELFQALFIRKTIQKLNNDLFTSILHLNFVQFHKKDSGEYLSNLSNDVKMVEDNYFTAFLVIMGEVVYFILTIAVLLWISPVTTVALIICGAILMVVPSIFSKPLQQRQNAVSSSAAGFTTKVKDWLQGYSVIHSFRIVGQTVGNFQTRNGEYQRSILSASQLQAIFSGVSMTLGVLTQVIGIAIGGFFVISGDLTVGSLIAIVQLGSGVVYPIQVVVAKYTQLKGVQEVNNKLLQMIKDTKINEDLLELPELNHSLSLENVSFSYEPGKPVLNQISFSFDKHKKYMILGRSGSGKSTLLKILQGFYKSDEGNLTLDDYSLNMASPEAISQRISVVPQKVYMFGENIVSNIVLGEAADPVKLERALEISGSAEFVNRLEQGLHTDLSHHGDNLSGGQIQRLGIARALYREPSILLLDECTASLDIETSLDIERRLLSLDGVTLIHVTHKLHKQLLPMYDEIILMDQGMIVEHGNYDELMDKRGYFFELQSLFEDDANYKVVAEQVDVG